MPNQGTVPLYLLNLRTVPLCLVNLGTVSSFHPANLGTVSGQVPQT